MMPNEKLALHLHKRDLLRGAAALALAGVLPVRLVAQAAPVLRKRLNLLFITADDLDWSVLGFMGGRMNLTPNLDALAARSHRFVNNRTVAPICMPSRQAFMSGLLPHHNGGTGFIPMTEGTPSLTTILKAQGYFTGAIHKVDHMMPQSSFPWDFVQQGKGRHTLLQAQGAEVAIAEAEAQSKPFFVQCNINDPHRPFYGSPAAAEVDHGDAGPYKIAREVGPGDVVVPPMLDDLPPIRAEIAQYWNSVQRLDAAVGHILGALRASGHQEDTAIVFCADHGMPFPFSKATCYDHGTRVPVLISWPGMGPAREFRNLTTNLDILPTVLELLGAPPPPALDGRSWMPIIKGESGGTQEFVFTYVNEVSSGLSYPTRAVQDDQYSLIFSAWADGKLALRLESMLGLTYPAMIEAARTDAKMAARVKQYVYGVRLALYDLKSDPGQRRNLIDDPAQKRRAARMKDILFQEMQRTKDPQLANYRSVLAGGSATVPQDPDRFRLRGGE